MLERKNHMKIALPCRTQHDPWYAMLWFLDPHSTLDDNLAGQPGLADTLRLTMRCLSHCHHESVQNSTTLSFRGIPSKQVQHWATVDGPGMLTLSKHTQCWLGALEVKCASILYQRYCLTLYLRKRGVIYWQTQGGSNSCLPPWQGWSARQVFRLCKLLLPWFKI